MKAGNVRRRVLLTAVLAVLSAALVVVVATAGVFSIRARFQQIVAARVAKLHPWTRVLLKAQHLSMDNRYSEADSVACIALQMTIDSVGPEDQDVAKCLEMRADLAWGARMDQVESLERLAVRIRERDSAGFRQMAFDLGDLGRIAAKQGRIPEAESLYRQACEFGKGGDGQGALFSLNRLGMLRLAQGDLAGAETLLQETARRYRLLEGSENSVARVLDSLAVIYQRQGRSVEAVRARKEAARQRANGRGLPN